MKAKVLRKYQDKNTGKLHEKNAIVNMTDERFEELFNKGFVTFAPDQEKTSPSKIEGKENKKLKTLKTK